MDNKTILFIEPYGAILSLLNRGVTNGFNIILFTAHRDLRMVPKHILESVQSVIQIDTADETKVLTTVKELSEVTVINAVIPGFEYFVPIAAKINHYLGLPGIHPAAVMKLRRKDLMRLALQNAGILQPNFFIVDSSKALEKAIQKIGFPAICKPLDAAGSVNVRKVQNKSEAIFAARRILEGNDILWGHPLANALLFEEYIAGKEFSVEGIVQNDRVIFFSITEKFVADQLEFIEIGHIVNILMDNKVKKSIEDYVTQVIKALCVNHCPFHAEIRLNNNGLPVLMEIAARLAGDKIGDLINLARGINYFDYIYDTCLGILISSQKMHEHHAGIRFFYRPNVEKYSTIHDLKEIEKYPLEEIKFYYQPEQTIPSFPKPLRRLGHAIMKNDRYDYLAKTLEEIDKCIIFN